MASNFKAQGNVMPFTVTGSPTVAGTVMVIGDIVGVVQDSKAVGETAHLGLGGVYEIPKDAGFDPAQGAPVFWDAGNGEAESADATGRRTVGTWYKAPAASAAVGLCRFDGIYTPATP